MNVEAVPYGGWKRCLRIANKQIEVFVTTEVGPRIIRFGFIDGQNGFVEYPEQVEKKSDGAYHIAMVVIACGLHRKIVQKPTILIIIRLNGR